MAKRNIIKTPDTTNDNNIIVGLVTDIASYMACYQISSIINCRLSINTIPWHYENNETSDEAIDFEYFKWSSETKGKKILVIPNIQSFDIFEQSSITSLYANEITVTTKHYTILPAWKHVKYIMRFEGYENEEIIAIAEKIRGSKKMQLVVTSYVSEIDNISVIYFFN
ncbi:MAG TPA: hypothetical protein PLY32_04145 [Salinivirgaceae bacterium]|nr:hypothetical protein [Salinivirgaceae bacterium]HQA76293.1 hypothetical protein [Salinivirgaceae bacterium]